MPWKMQKRKFCGIRCDANEKNTSSSMKMHNKLFKINNIFLTKSCSHYYNWIERIFYGELVSFNWISSVQEYWIALNDDDWSPSLFIILLTIFNGIQPPNFSALPFNYYSQFAMNGIWDTSRYIDSNSNLV